MERGMFDSPLVKRINAGATALIGAPIVGRLLRRGLVVIRYTGRRSGKSFEIPVGYRRRGDSILIGVTAPDKKTWWRNFLGGGAPLTLVDFDGADRSGHAVAQRDAQGRVSVAVRLDGG
jgi:hypothetical protein